MIKTEILVPGQEIKLAHGGKVMVKSESGRYAHRVLYRRAGEPCVRMGARWQRLHERVVLECGEPWEVEYWSLK